MLKKAAVLTRPTPASEEARRYIPHLVCGRLPLQRLLANGETPLVFPTSEKLNVEPLSEARTPLAGFFSILLSAELNALS